MLMCLLLYLFISSHSSSFDSSLSLHLPPHPTFTFHPLFPSLGCFRIKASSRKQFLDNFGSLQQDEQPLKMIKDIDGDAAELILDGLIPDTEYTFQVLSLDSNIEVSWLHGNGECCLCTTGQKRKKTQNK